MAERRGDRIPIPSPVYAELQNHLTRSETSTRRGLVGNDEQKLASIPSVDQGSLLLCLWLHHWSDHARCH